MAADVRTSQDARAGRGPFAARRRAPGAWAIPLALVVVHVVLQLQVRPNPRWNDAIFVLNYARDFPDVPVTHHALRLGNLIPARLLIEVVGYGQLSYYVWPFLTSILLVVACYALGSALLNRYVGTVAALLVVLSPILLWTAIEHDVERMTSWHLLPDIPTAAFFTAGLALLVHGSGQAATQGPRGRVRPWLLVSAGLCLGWAYLVRELAAFCFPAILVALIAFRLPWRRWWLVAAPMVGLLVGETLLAWWVHGDALARFSVGAEHAGPPRTELSRTTALLGLGRALDNYPGWELVLALLVLTLLGAVFIRQRGLVLLATWFVSYWFPLTLVSGLLDPSSIKINMTLTRYWIPILPPVFIGGCIVVALAFAAVRRRLEPRWHGLLGALGAVLTAAVLAVYVWPVADEVAQHPGDAQWNSLRSYLSQHDDQVDAVATDERSALILGIYKFAPAGGDAAWRADIDTFAHSQSPAPSADEIRADVLLWTPESGALPTSEQGWTEVWSRSELSLYVSADSPSPDQSGG